MARSHEIRLKARPLILTRHELTYQLRRTQSHALAALALGLTIPALIRELKRHHIKFMEWYSPLHD